MKEVEKVAFWTGKWSNPDQTQLLILDVQLDSGCFSAHLKKANDLTEELWQASGQGGFSDELTGQYHDAKSGAVIGQVRFCLKTKQTTEDLSGNQITCQLTATPDKAPDPANTPKVVYTNVSGPTALVPELELTLERMSQVTQKIRENAQTVEQVEAALGEFINKGLDVSAALPTLHEQRDKMLEYHRTLKVRLHLLNYASRQFAELIQPIDLALPPVTTTKAPPPAMPPTQQTSTQSEGKGKKK